MNKAFLAMAAIAAVGGAGRWLSAGWDDWTWLCCGAAAGLLALAWLVTGGSRSEPEVDDPTTPR